LATRATPQTVENYTLKGRVARHTPQAGIVLPFIHLCSDILMTFLPSPREIRRRLPLVAGALLFTQVPALPLLLLSGGLSRLAIAAYLVASIVAGIGLISISVAWMAVIERIVALVRGDPDCSLERVQSSLASLDRAVRNLESDAARDPLTGILNRRTCSTRLESDIARSRRGGAAFSLALFDLDDLKTINDGQGHAAGDAALRRLAQALQSVTREGDWAARWGGDEFLLALWGADAESAALVATRILVQLSTDPETIAEHGHPLGASVGIGQAQPEDDATRLFSRADKALFEAKRSGRGRVNVS
jgi:diguanylate cyclase (GGDEF)-like protein